MVKVVPVKVATPSVAPFWVVGIALSALVRLVWVPLSSLVLAIAAVVLMAVLVRPPAAILVSVTLPSVGVRWSLRRGSLSPAAIGLVELIGAVDSLVMPLVVVEASGAPARTVLSTYVLLAVWVPRVGDGTTGEELKVLVPAIVSLPVLCTTLLSLAAPAVVIAPGMSVPSGLCDTSR